MAHRKQRSRNGIGLFSGLLPPLLAVFLFACSADAPEPPKENPTRLDARVTASKDVNPNAGGQPSPIRVRIYELAADAAFNSAGFSALYGNDQVVLGNDLQGREEMVLTPGQTATIQRDCKPGAGYVGVIAAFQEQDKATWRASAPIAKGQMNKMSIEISRLSVSIVSRKE